MKNILILASSSPRRKELLDGSCIRFKVVKHSFDESSVKATDPVKYAKDLAYLKALSVAERPAYGGRYILGVDTIVVIGNRVLGKPADKKEAEKFVRMLSGRTHRVLSGISLINRKNAVNITKCAVSFVKFSKIDEDFIKYYLDNEHWKGYAGGYAIQGIFSLLAEKIRGSYSNIVGLPVELLYKMLKEADPSLISFYG